MYNLAPENAPWFEHLTDSVRGLGEAAREWQLAHQAASLAHAHMNIGRTVLHEGKITGQPEHSDRGWLSKPFTRTPHSTAVSALQRHYLDALHYAQNEYEHTALLFASGAAWAIRTVHASKQPERVVFTAEDVALGKRALVPGSFDARLDAFKEARYSKTRQLETAYKRLGDCLWARQAAEDIGGQEYVADHEASQMHEYWGIAEGLADAAYAYGLLAEQALSFVLLGPRGERRKQLAAERAAQAEQTSEADQ